MMSGAALRPHSSTLANRLAVLDGNEATADVAYRLSDLAAIYPITPSSPMGELADAWAGKGRTNLWGTVPTIAEMQSEGGAAGAVHGAVTAGALATTFTASQGLLLMIPNMYKIAGELTPFVMHVAARAVATHALSIFGDHSDVMGVRQTGFAMLAANSVQEAHDMAAVAHAASLESRIPFLHFFDGFRTSHELGAMRRLSDEALGAIIDEDAVRAHRNRALTPDRPEVRGTAHNPDTFFQAREACNPFYDACPGIVADVMDRLEQASGRRYGLFEYHGHPEAERVLVLMGSGVETARQTALVLAEQGEKVGVIAVRLYRPFADDHFARSLPASTRTIAVLDRTKEPGAPAEPLCLDVIAALRGMEAAGTLPTGAVPRVIGGRYGLSSKEFTPASVKAVFDECAREHPRQRFTLGINDDVTRLSLDIDESFAVESDAVFGAVFYGLGSDGSVGANKGTIKILGEATDLHAQGYFVYDSKKSGSWTVSHLRFAPEPIRSPYLVASAKFVACHQFNFLTQRDVLACAAPGATFLLNAPHGPTEVWDTLPAEVQMQIIDKGLKFHVVDASAVATEAGIGGRINRVMQACFFALTDLLPTDEAMDRIRRTIAHDYGKMGDEVVRRNNAALDGALQHLHEVTVPESVTSELTRRPAAPDDAPEFVQRVTAMMMEGKGDRLPVSAFPPDGSWPTSTTRFEKRSIASDIPVWDPDVCIQCNKCALICPHAAIRAKAYEPGDLEMAPDGFRSVDYKAKDLRGLKYTIQVAPEDCTGCNLCVNVCPAKNKAEPRRKAINMTPKAGVLDAERANYEHFLGIKPLPRDRVVRIDAKGSQFFEPLFEYSGACAGCGETPYVKLLTQLFGDRLMLANATGCSSIYGGNLPTTPYCVDDAGRGPAWSNSLFEDNAEFGFGMKLATDTLGRRARLLLERHASRIGGDLVAALIEADQSTERGIRAQRERVAALRDTLTGTEDPGERELALLADYLVKKSQWLVGGDGWAFDIGYGGLDHVLAQTHDINVLVLDTEVYSNTGGQASKATPIGAAAKFAATGKVTDKKDLGLMAMQYGHVYVASVAMGAKDTQTVSALLEAESYPGPSLVIAYSHCIAHGYNLAFGADQQKRAVDSGVWPLYRYDPRRIADGKPPLTIDAQGGKIRVAEYLKNETRFRMVERMDPERFRVFGEQAQRAAEQRIAVYAHMADLRLGGEPTAGSDGTDTEASTEGGAT
jgi:pyruvate-ferredoxin/flavodoxin oxidoreductase